MSGLADFLRTASGELGTVEDPPGSNRTKYGDWYGMSAAWCGMFVSWCAHTSGNTDVVPRFAWTPAGAEWFQQRGQWSRQPAVGAIAFYDVSGQGRISHTGIVTSLRFDGAWLAIEGNTDVAGGRTGGRVMRQLRTTTGTSRGGFGHPRWSTVPNDHPSWGAQPLLRRGATGDPVRRLQGALNAVLRGRGLAPLVVDGQFGNATLTAVVVFQRLRGLTPDGVVGKLTWAALAG